MKKGWGFKPLKDVCKIFADGDWVESKDQSNEGIRLVQTGNIGFGFFKDKEDKARYISEETFHRLKCTEVLPGDLLVSRLPDPVGKSCIIPDLDFKMITGVDCTIIRPKDNLLSEFLCYYQQSMKYLKDVQKGVTGTTRSRISRKNLGLILIPIPPINEQQKIIEILDEAFEAIDQAKANIEKNIANAKELFQSKLNEIFSKKGDGWEEKSLGELGKVSMCKRILKNQTTTEGDIPFYKIGTFGKSPDAYISKDIYEEFKSNYSFPKKGDILISASGTIGRRVIYDGEPAFFQDSNIVWIDNDEKLVLNEYLFHFYGVCDWNPSKGATINRLYNDDLRRIRISFPNRDEQRRLIRLMDEFSARSVTIKENYIRKLKNLDELKKSILQKAFSGELTAHKLLNE
jgi:type I restriction enzyme S subunit